MTPVLGGPPHWTPRELWSRLRIPNIDEEDLYNVSNRAGQILYEDRGRAEQVIGTTEFRDWFLDSNSTKLLIHGDFDTMDDVSPFSVLCATLHHAFRSTQGVIGLVFFCGCHIIRDEYFGGAVMIRSLIAQLLRQFPFAAIEGDFGSVIDLDNTNQLCHYFIQLIRRLPSNMTVFCLIDGIKEYEREDYLHGMDDVIYSLLDLVAEIASHESSADCGG